jgi:hypothetical protein
VDQDWVASQFLVTVTVSVTVMVTDSVTSLVTGEHDGHWVGDGSDACFLLFRAYFTLRTGSHTTLAGTNGPGKGTIRLEVVKALRKLQAAGHCTR